MKAARMIYHMARADFLERVRRYSFLVMLGLVLFLGYQTAIGNLNLTLGQYRGEFNSAWVGAMMSLIAGMFIGWFGFFLVKGSVARDRETGVGQIIATTPLSRPLYLLGKWLSNFAVLMAMVATLAVAGIVLQFWQGESTQINISAFLAPFLLIVLPLMALVGAVAVFFEVIPFLQGGFGNVIYFIAFIAFIPLFLENNLLSQYDVFEPMGLGLLSSDMGQAVRQSYPDYNGDFTLGNNGAAIEGIFVWEGVQWTPALIFGRLSLILLAVALVMGSALFFDRFDPARRRLGRRTAVPPASEAVPTESAVLSAGPAPPITHLTPLNTAANSFRWGGILLAELKLLLKGQRWWWYAVAGVLAVVGLGNDAATTREIIMPLAWVWPILIWSAMGNREMRHHVQQVTFAAASPLWRQLPAQWVAGFLVTLLMASGALVRLGLAGDGAGLLALGTGALFIPSLALAAGVWSGSSKLFEVVYMVLWYIGPLNRVAELDYMGASGAGRPLFFAGAAVVLVGAAVVGRARQLRG